MVKAQQPDIAQYYSEVRLTTTSKRRGIYLLHERCVHLIRQSIQYREKRREILDRAQNILAQLQQALLVDDSTSQCLDYLYEYCYVLLDRGGIPEIRHSLRILSPLKETFYALLMNP